MHGRPPERHGVRQTRSALIWGLAIPVIILALAWPLPIVALLLVAIYPLQIARLARREARRRKLPARDAWAYGAALVVGKFAELMGVLKFWTGKLRGKRSTLIEYKTAAAPAQVS